MLTRSESNPILAKAKASLAKKPSIQRGSWLDDAVELAWFFVALDRAPEARELCEFISERAVFANDYDTWTFAADAIVLEARLARLDGDAAKQRELIARIVEHPALAEMPKNDFQTWVAQSDKLKKAREEKSRKWACIALYGCCSSCAYFLETAGAGFYYDTWVDRRELQDRLAAAIAELRKRLTPR